MKKIFSDPFSTLRCLFYLTNHDSAVLDCAADGSCCKRVFGPIVPRIASPHVFTHERIPLSPESREVFRNLNGTMRWREQGHNHGDTPRGQARRLHKPKAFLQLRLYGRLIPFIMDEQVTTARYFHTCRRERVKFAQGVP